MYICNEDLLLPFLLDFKYINNKEKDMNRKTIINGMLLNMLIIIVIYERIKNIYSMIFK
jgi:hypothetical protein